MIRDEKDRLARSKFMRICGFTDAIKSEREGPDNMIPPRRNDSQLLSALIDYVHRMEREYNA